MATDNPRMCTLKNVRLSFTDSLKTARATVEGGTPKHTVNILIEPDKAETEANKAAAAAALKAAGTQEWDKEDMYKSLMSDKPDRCSFRKGERYKDAEDNIYNGYEGAFVISAAGPGGNKSPKRPVILDRKKERVSVDDIPDVAYAGVYADCKVEFYPVSGKDRGGNGIFATVQVIRSRQVGDRMAGGYTYSDKEADDFDDLEDEADDEDFG